MQKTVNVCEFLKTCSLRSNRVTRQVSFNRTKIGENAKLQKFKCDILGDFNTLCNSTHIVHYYVLAPQAILTIYSSVKKSISTLNIISGECSVQIQRRNVIFLLERILLQYSATWCRQNFKRFSMVRKKGGQNSQIPSHDLTKRFAMFFSSESFSIHDPPPLWNALAQR